MASRGQAEKIARMKSGYLFKPDSARRNEASSVWCPVPGAPVSDPARATHSNPWKTPIRRSALRFPRDGSLVVPCVCCPAFRRSVRRCVTCRLKAGHRTVAVPDCPSSASEIPPSIMESNGPFPAANPAHSSPVTDGPWRQRVNWRQARASGSCFPERKWSPDASS